MYLLVKIVITVESYVAILSKYKTVDPAKETFYKLSPTRIKCKYNDML